MAALVTSLPRGGKNQKEYAGCAACYYNGRERRERMTSTQSLDAVLLRVRAFIDSMFWGPEEYSDAMTLILAFTHVMEYFDTAPYVLVTSRDPKVGKSTLSKNIPFLLADRPWRVSANTTTDALRNKFLDRERPKVLLMDDASKFYGEGGTARKTAPLYQMSVDGYENNATVSVSRGGVSRDLPAYIMLFMNGLNNAVPDDLATRAVQFRLRPKPESVRLKLSALSPEAAKEAEPLKRALHQRTNAKRKEMQLFLRSQGHRIHPLLNDRLMQVWGGLFAVAHAAGGSWPRRCLSAFLSMALDEGNEPVLFSDQRVLLDAAKLAVKTGTRVLFTADLVPALRNLPSGFYDDLGDSYLVGQLLPAALGAPDPRLRGKSLDGRLVTGQGWLAAPVLRAAADLEEELYPETADRAPDPVEQALTLTEVS